jgi:hypothetical protein
MVRVKGKAVHNNKILKKRANYCAQQFELCKLMHVSYFQVAEDCAFRKKKPELESSGCPVGVCPDKTL